MGTTRTTKIIRRNRKPSEEALENRKIFNQSQKLIRDAVSKGFQSIPAIADATGLQSNIVTYVLMTMRKYGEITEKGPDDRNEYFFYEMKEANS
jgi:hypothetical protein